MTAHAEDLPGLVREQASSRPGEVFLQDVSGRARTFRQVEDAAAAWARALRHVGVGPGDTVALFTGTRARTVECWLGVARIGGVEVPLNTALRGRLLHYVLEDAGARVAVAGAGWLDRFAGLPAAVTATLELIVVLDAPGDLPGRIGPVRLVAAEDLLAAAEAGPDTALELDRGDVACVIYTSGTTGPSKGVNVTWAQLAATAAGSMPPSGAGGPDVYYNPFPLFHISGKFAILRQAAIGSAAVLRDGFDTAAFWGDIARYGCTATLLLGATANFLYRQPERPDDADTPLRDVVMVPLVDDLDGFRRRFGVRVCTVFNMTELSAPLASGWNPADSRSCGRPREGYECIVADEDGREVAAGVVGELLVRAADPAMLNAGYRNKPGATAEAWRDGWFHTGDGFVRDESGSFTFVDRMKDAIRRRGENISSAELEAEVLAHPAVQECAAVAVPAEVGEDEVKIVVVVKPARTLTPPELVDFLEPRVAWFMVPRYVEIVPELPKTATQKIQKNVLRDAGVTAATWERPARRRPAAAEGGIR